MEIACRRDGTILAMRGRIYGDMGAYIRTNGGVVPRKAGQFLHGPYRIPNLTSRSRPIMTSKTPVGTYRAPGRFEANFFRERLFDMAARDLSIDPVEFRRKNLIRESELPYSIGQLVPYETPTEYDTGDYHASFERCLDGVRLEGKAAPARRTDRRPLSRRSPRLPSSKSGGAGPRENAQAHSGARWTVSIDVGSSALGQGLETCLRRSPATRSRCRSIAFRVRHGSTTLVHEGFGTYHSRATGDGRLRGTRRREKSARAIRNAAAAQIRLRAESEMQYSPMAACAVPAAARSPRRTRAGLAADPAQGTFANTKRTYSYGAHAAHVAVDPGTGKVEVLDYLAVEDVGRAVNPGIVHGQAIGAAVQGLGGVFLDHIIYDEQAQLLNASFAIT